MMSLTVVIVNALVAVVLIISFIKDEKKTWKSLSVALKSFIRILPMVLVIIIFIGLLLGFVPPDKISRIIGEQSGFGGVVITALLGAVLHIPSLISFPLASSLLKVGASVTATSAFITTLTMIGTVTLPLEIKELGRKFTLLRNGVSFMIAIIIAFIMGMISCKRNFLNFASVLAGHQTGI
jgi:uncharacterized membrane protein YraQ (UPF0718 family)